MKKTLVYHLYIDNDCEDNIVYNVHKFCLMVFLDVFDEVKLTIFYNGSESDWDYIADLYGYKEEFKNFTKHIKNRISFE